MECKVEKFVEQGTAGWKKLRLGRIGSSEVSTILTSSKGNKIPTGMQTLAYKKWAERITGRSSESGFVSKAMENGHTLEPFARERYRNEKKETGQDVKIVQVGYISLGDYVGYSPDGLVLKDGLDTFSGMDDVQGLIEIKSPELLEYTRYMDTREIKKEHIAQMQWGMWITDLPWCDYVVFNPYFTKPILIHRVEADEEMQDMFKERVGLFEKEINRINSNYQNI